MINRTTYIKQIKPFIAKDVVKVLTGMRRSGKSTLLEQIRDELITQGVPLENVLTVNFESLEFDHLTHSHKAFYNEIIRIARERKGKFYLLFDEIQTVVSWEKAINSLRVDLDCDIYITGSNASLLAGELSTLLAGRYVAFEVMPFSFSEVAEALPKMNKSEVFALYRTIGGLPFLAQVEFKRRESLTYLSDVYNSIMLRDIVQRNGFRDADQLARVLTYFLSEIGTTFSVKNIANVFAEERRPVSRESIYNYISAAEEAMLFSRVKRYDIKGKDILKGNEKVYITDVGIREALLGNNATRIDIVLENIVFNELKRRGFDISIGKNGNKEIDFIASKGSDIRYIQVTYLLAHEETIAREFGAFVGITDNYPKTVISMDTVDFSRDGIRHINIEDFLMEEQTT